MARTVRPVKKDADAAAYDGEILPGVHLVSSAHTGAHGGRVYLCGATGTGNRRAATNAMGMVKTMCFEQMYDSSKRGELLLIDGGLCHWHLRRDGQLTIREIIATRPGAGSAMLDRLRCVARACCIVAKCPADLDSNKWYATKGFLLDHTEQAKSGRGINVWRLTL